LPAEIVVGSIANLLNWRDLCALIVCCQLDLRPFLTEKELKSICTSVNEFKKLSPTSLDFFDWNVLLTVPPNIFVSEYHMLAKNIDWHYENLNGVHPPAPYVPNYASIDRFETNLCQNSLILEHLRENFVQLQTPTPDHIAFHPSQRIVAISVLRQLTGANQSVLSRSSLQIRSFGSTDNRCQGGHILYESGLFFEKGLSYGQKRLYPEWSPCGLFLSVVERAPNYSGRHSLARLHVFTFNNETFEVCRIKNFDVCCLSSAISNRLWLGPGLLVLPEPLDQGGEPCLIQLSSNPPSAVFRRPSEYCSETAFNHHPSGMLTGLSDGRAAFVRYCYKRTTTSSSVEHLGGHEHHVVVVLDDKQQRSFEISVPGLVLEIASRDHRICLLYRPHAAINFSQEYPTASAPSRPTQEKFRPQYFAPFSFLKGDV